MTKAFILLTFAVTLASAQAQIVIRPANPAGSSGKTPPRKVEAARPLLGYVTNSSSVIYSVAGSSATPVWGDPLHLPDSTTAAFLPPRQEYALLSSEAGLSMARLGRSGLARGAMIPKVTAKPDLVAFSPSGTAAALVSTSESKIEVLKLVDGEARLYWSMPAANVPGLKQLALSDDAELLVAAFAVHDSAYSLHGAGWRQLAAGYWPDALTFLPASHDLVLADEGAKVLVLLPQPEHEPLTPHVLSSGRFGANLLSVNKQGNKVLAAEAGTSWLWSVDLVTGALSSVPAKGIIDSLLVLRDGQTFLVSTKESPVVVNLSGNSAQAVAGNSFR